MLKNYDLSLNLNKNYFMELKKYLLMLRKISQSTEII